MLKFQIYQSQLKGTSAYGWSRMLINENVNDNDNVHRRACCVRKRTGWENANYRELLLICNLVPVIVLYK